MSSTTFAQRIAKAATDYPGGTSTAWVQYTTEGRTVFVRMQSPEIMKEFRGNVKFGVDPKGILFFSSKDDLDIIGNIKVRNARYPVSGTKVIVETEFGSPGGGFDGFARFVSEVDTSVYNVPVFDSSAIGSGTFKPYDAVTCHVQASRSGRNATVNLGSSSIHKQAYFTSKVSNVNISQSGVMFFTDLEKLKTKPNNRENCVANYTKERIVFHIQNAENEFVALFLPNKPMSDIGPMDAGNLPTVTWENIESTSASAIATEGA
ncbi:hypothetical protein BGY98DRAFT_1098835 [Russula aff. rugulosa BPL654]|nr:hypothetical protein BGY98DRAFT_1098835 [Russula aff. rugulosa BPL654]